MSTTEVRREEDGELLGHLRLTGSGWEPVTVFHAALAGPTSREEAEDVVRRDGLPSLGDPWWAEEAPGRWTEVRIQEAHPDRLRVRWTDPLAEQPALGRWIDPREVRVRRHHPGRR
ncbi:hypothetical protein [Amycolatopsis sp. DG1A-15b]|uniref:hypothetical protein n=1 Tax=Amycolatopsis sp. DG1A-15b TaxID=3052846 RepID=UPI00255C22A4|nr:hypothetical protein [Amycolatopsis sp. DG1A-15b]WIX91619.1 hypothetical protein QRY02_14760 [Amycolatopsis sp. DG1A-15b]